MIDDDAETSDRDPETGHFIMGKKGGPGRPKGSRSKLGEQFLADMFADWQEHGVAAIVATREKDPVAYVKVVASILPKELKVGKSDLDDLSDDQLDARLRIFLRALSAEGALDFLNDAEGSDGGTPPDGAPIH